MQFIAAVALTVAFFVYLFVWREEGRQEGLH